MTTHFSRAPDDDEHPEQAPCGTLLGESSELSSNWVYVNCRACIKRKDKIVAAGAAEERAIVQHMGDMAEFMGAQQGVTPS